MRLRVDIGMSDAVDGAESIAGWIEVPHPDLLERMRDCALVPALVKDEPGGEFRVDHFDMIPRENVDTRPLEEIARRPD